MADREAVFYRSIGNLIKSKNIEPLYLSFNQMSNELFDDGDIFLDYYTQSVEKHDLNIADKEIISSINHEAETYKLKKNRRIKEKYKKYRLKTYSILKNLKKRCKGNILVVQELGGFISQLSVFYSSQELKIEHLFLEPSFFSGKIFINKNTILAPEIDSKKNTNKDTTDFVINYLNQIVTDRNVVLPDKDKRHFKKMGVKKYFNVENFIKFIKKFIGKYIFRKKFEFNYLFTYSMIFLKRYINWLLSKKYYKKISSISNNDNINVYFPLHVPNDYSFTVRSPEHNNQFDLVKRIAQICKRKNLNLYLKEHPAGIGDFKMSEVKSLVKQGVTFLNPSENTYDVLKRIEILITVNSKSGAEGIIQNKTVIALGNSFYSNSGMVYNASIDNLEEIIKNVMTSNEKLEYFDFFSNVFEKSVDCELYNNNSLNLENMSKILINYFETQY